MSKIIQTLTAIAVLVSVVSATITSPAPGDSWALNSEHEIKWDTAGLKEPLELHLAPAGSTDASSYISTLAPTIPNTGSWSWTPTPSIPQHSSFQIIIIDLGGKHQTSPPFQMIGWPQQPPSHQQPPTHVLPPVHTPLIPPPAHVVPPTHVAPPVHIAPTSPPAHVVPPPAHVVPPPVHETVINQPSAILITSLLVQTLVHTSQPQPIIKTIEAPPLIQTEHIAPIIVTQDQQPVTKVQTQPDSVLTETLAPIIKTILVTETPSPIIKTITHEPVTVIHTQAPILVTESQAPIVKTLTQAPHLVTEHLSPVVMTSEITQTIHLTSFVHPAQPPAHTVAPPAHVPIVVHPSEPAPPAQQHTSVQAIHPSVVQPLVPTHPAGLVQSAPPIFLNTTFITSASILPTFTTPLKLAVTAPGAAAGTSGLGGLQGQFTGAGVMMSSLSWGLLGSVAAAFVVMV